MMEVGWSKIQSSGTAFHSGNAEETDYTQFSDQDWEGSISLDVEVNESGLRYLEMYFEYLKNRPGGGRLSVNEYSLLTIGDLEKIEMAMLYGNDIFKLDSSEKETLISLYRDGLLFEGSEYMKRCISKKEGNNA